MTQEPFQQFCNDLKLELDTLEPTTERKYSLIMKKRNKIRYFWKFWTNFYSRTCNSQKWSSFFPNF